MHAWILNFQRHYIRLSAFGLFNRLASIPTTCRPEYLLSIIESPLRIKAETINHQNSNGLTVFAHLSASMVIDAILEPHKMAPTSQNLTDSRSNPHIEFL